MLHPFARALRLPLLLSLILFAGGCSALMPRPDYMRAAPTPPELRASPGKALVVFVRRSIFGFALVPVIIDGKGRFIGEIPSLSWFSTELDPGDYRFVIFQDHQHVMRATLSPDRVYFVEVTITLKVSDSETGRPNLIAVNTQDERALRVLQLPDLDHYVPNTRSGQAHLVQYPDQIRSVDGCARRKTKRSHSTRATDAPARSPPTTA
ncbi:MAG TPA: hypothetical protein VK524_34255 [Polyangiaceae bacterium]|nr:hypothetical protein [Polyangiaceae bacterium]